MNEYLVQLKGIYLIPDELKDLFKNLNLKKEFYKINEDTNIQVDYMSFLVKAENQFDVTSKNQFNERLKEGLRSKDEEKSEVYIQYMQYIQYQFDKSNFQLQELYIKPTGRQMCDNGYIYNEKFVDYSLLTSKEKSDTTYIMTRILTSYEINELEDYYSIITDRIHKQDIETYSNKDNLIELLNHFYMKQKQEILSGKKISMVNMNRPIKWKMGNKLKLNILDYDYFFWESKNEYNFKNSKYNFKYKYFININHDGYGFDCDKHIISLDLIIDSKSLSQGRLEYIAKENNIDKEDISYPHINSSKPINNWRFNLYNKRLNSFDLEKILGIENYSQKYSYNEHYGEYEFNPELLIKDILKPDASLNINLSDYKFKEFYIDMLELSLVDRFIEINEIKSKISKEVEIMNNVLTSINSPEFSLNGDHNQRYFNGSGFSINYINQLHDYLNRSAEHYNICTNCYSKELEKSDLSLNMKEYICEECKIKYKKEMGEWEAESYGSLPKEAWESIDNMME